MLRTALRRRKVPEEASQKQAASNALDGVEGSTLSQASQIAAVLDQADRVEEAGILLSIGFETIFEYLKVWTELLRCHLNWQCLLRAVIVPPPLSNPLTHAVSVRPVP